MDVNLKIMLLTVAGILPVYANAVTPKKHKTPKSEKPNIVLFMAEDLSRNCLELYTGNGAKTPNLDKMAAHGVVYNNAYCNAPVSSAARSSLITGCYGPSLGISWHRKLELVTLPEDLRLFPYYLRQLGYFTTNASKTDYNCNMDLEAWDIVKGKIDAFRKRKDYDQPFYHCFTAGECHEHVLHFPESDVDKIPTMHDPSKVDLYPFHPDIKLFRYTYARLYDKINFVDGLLGSLIDILKEDGLLDNTFIIYVGDNGGSLPFSKGYTTEEGLNVPMVMYVPDNWKDVVPHTIGEHADEFVQFLDLSATFINLAGGKIPSHIDGTAFAGPGVTGENLKDLDEVFCYGDRYDELLSVNRTFRKGDFKYQRNLHPHQPKALHSVYRYKQAAFRQWRTMYEKNLLNDVQSQFFQVQTPEELYDLSKDPYETRNLAEDPTYRKQLLYMRARMEEKMISEGDLALIPEAIWLEHVTDITGFKDEVGDNFKDYCEVVQYQLLDARKFEKKFLKAIKSDDPVIRYWAMTACLSRKGLSAKVVKMITECIDDDYSLVKSRAAVYCLMNGITSNHDVMKRVVASAENAPATLAILNDIEYLYERLDGFRIELEDSDLKYYPDLYEWRIDHFKELNTAK